MLGCFNPVLGQIWTNPNLKTEPNDWVCPYLTQSWVETTLQFSECKVFIHFSLALCP